MSDTLGLFEQAVLLAVQALEPEAYGWAILLHIRSRWDREISAGAIYVTLARLVRQDMLVPRVSDAPRLLGGRQRQFYSLTRAGIVALNDTRAVHEALWRGVPWPLA